MTDHYVVIRLVLKTLVGGGPLSDLLRRYHVRSAGATTLRAKMLSIVKLSVREARWPAAMAGSDAAAALSRGMHEELKAISSSSRQGARVCCAAETGRRRVG